jgi:S-adenosylmethionine:tRNA ribosyltransferase-isomerase
MDQHVQLRTDELDFDLPADLIAVRPAEPRDSARMLVLWRSNDRVEHHLVRDLPGFLQAGDALVFNKSSVVPARFIGRRASTHGKVEGLYLGESGSAIDGQTTWRVMVKSGGRLHPGEVIELIDHAGCPHTAGLKLLEHVEDHWIVQVIGGIATTELLKQIGWTPLPPYILKARGDEMIEDDLDRRWYQTVFADKSQPHSVAAPTAGLHFTNGLLNEIRAKGVHMVEIMLHVGPGTFKPVTAATLGGHRMHAESFEVSDAARRALAVAKQRPTSRIIAVGTTSVRTLESLPGGSLENGENCGRISGMTDLLIAPPYEFNHVDGMLTNFHLPCSTLLALVAAMVGLDRLKTVYRQAIQHKYRFYSYGDAMLILP